MTPPVNTEGGLSFMRRYFTRDRIAGPLGLLGFVAILEISKRLGFPVPKPGFFIQIAVAYSTFRGGLLSGVACVALAILYLVFFTFIPAHPFTYAPDDHTRIVTFALSAPILLWLGTSLNRRLLTAEKLAAFNRSLEREMAERRAAEESRRVAEERLRLAVECADLGTWDFDPAKQEAVLSERCAQILGLGPATVTISRAGWLAIVHPDDREQVDGAMRRALDSGGDGKFEVEHRICWPDGTIRWVAARGHSLFEEKEGARGAVRLIGTKLDVTARKPLEEAMRISEERHRLAIDAAQLGTFFCPMPPDKILWNATCNEHFWFKPGAEVNLDVFYAALHPEDREPTRRAIQASLENREICDVEYRTMAPGGSGRFRWIHAVGRGYYNAEGHLTRFDGITMDVTSRKESALALQRAKQQAEEANQAKDIFLATVSHELRTPLNAILGWVKLLSLPELDSATEADALATIERNALAQARLIDDLLDVSRIVSGKMRLEVRPADLTDVIREALDAVRPAADARGVSLECGLDRDAGPWAGDPDRIQQVVWNLSSNAIKFTPRGGRVDVRLTRVDLNAEIVVSDTGIGISPAFLPHIFDSFTQAGGTGGQAGLGLGLAISRRLVELHGGTIRAASDGEEKGARFRVLLPLALDETKAQPPEVEDRDGSRIAEPVEATKT